MGDYNHGGGLAKPIAIYYEHPDWFRPLFQQLDERGANWLKIEARHHYYDAASPEREYSLLFNRMSPSAWQRGLAHGIFYTLNYLAHLEAQGVRVVNGYRCFAHETSKALQLSNLEKLGLPYPKARIINHPSQALAAAEAIGYPVVLKPNIGGSGAGIERFSSPDQLRAAVEANRLYFGIDSTALVQEAFAARGGMITRVEVLGGKYLYAIQIHTTGESFNLCPADICQNTRGEELTRIACPVDAQKNGMKVDDYGAPREAQRADRLGHNAQRGAQCSRHRGRGRGLTRRVVHRGGVVGGHRTHRTRGGGAAYFSFAGTFGEASSQHRSHQQRSAHAK